MTLRSRSLRTSAVDVAVAGLQKRPTSANVFREGSWMFPDPGIMADIVTKPKNILVLQLKAGNESKLMQPM
jgi:hypothetical protein